MALAPGLADLDVLWIRVADRADGRTAVHSHQPHFTRGQPQCGHALLLGHELDRGARRAAELAAAAGLELDVVHHRADRHAGERQRVADADLDARSGLEASPHAQPLWREDVALLAIGV